MVGGKGLMSTPRVSGMWHRSGFGKTSWTGRGLEAGAHGARAERAVLSCCVSLGAAPSGAPQCGVSPGMGLAWSLARCCRQRSSAARGCGALAWLRAGSAQGWTAACDTSYLASSEMQCSGHPDGFVTLPVGLCAHKPIKGLHCNNVESILCSLSNAGIIQLVTG